jgi:hypothetical protein
MAYCFTHYYIPLLWGRKGCAIDYSPKKITFSHGSSNCNSFEVVVEQNGLLFKNPEKKAIESTRRNTLRNKHSTSCLRFN